MSNISRYLIEEHRHCDDLFAAAEMAAAKGDWISAEAGFSAFRRDTERHLAREEQVLFPDFESHTGSSMGPTYVMRMEHEQMRELMARMADAVAAKGREDFLGLAETLLILMQQHNMKEEQILYPMTERILQDPEGLLVRLRAVHDDNAAAGVGV